MKKGSIILTCAAVIVCTVALIGLSVAAPSIADWFARFRGIGNDVKNAILVSYYICTVPAFISLVCLFRILDNIRREEPFLAENAFLMALVSYCCMAVVAVTVACGYFYMPMWFVSAAMLFVFLIVRVVRHCFIAAIRLKEENSLTI